MKEPDFSKYTEAQLRQVLSRIDAVRHPDRVADIEARLSAMASAPRHVEVDQASVTAASMGSHAGRWRRIGAFLIDMLILGVIGMTAGAILGEQFSALGASGILLGFVMTLAYLGVTQSRVGGGQSIGMRALRIRVVSRTGDQLSMPAALLRSAIFCLAYFLNGANFAFGFTSEWVAWVISTAIFGLVFSVFYLLLFNRRTLQSIHDLVTGAFVIKAEPSAVGVSTAPVWRGHAAIICITVLALSFGGVLISKHFLPKELMTALWSVQKAISAMPGVDRVSVKLNTSLLDNKPARILLIGAVVDGATPDPEALAQRMAQIAMKNDVQLNRPQSIIVTLTSGYDIGIASSWRSTNFAHTPEEWQARSGIPRT